MKLDTDLISNTTPGHRIRKPGQNPSSAISPLYYSRYRRLKNPANMSDMGSCSLTEEISATDLFRAVRIFLSPA